jgi:hypothetical protein
VRPSSWAILAGATALALVAMALFPRSGADAPPLASLALIGAVVAAVTTAAFVVIVRRDLALPARAVVPFALALVLIAAVKFVLAPLGLYEVNALRALDDYFGTVGDPAGAAVTAGAVLGLYAVAYWLVYRLSGAGARAPLRPPRAEPRRRRIGGGTVVAGVVAVGLLAVSGIWLLALAILTAPGQYLEFVFGSGVGVVVLVLLAAAAALIGWWFRTLTIDRGFVVDVGTVVALFWLGLGFLALYHALWIVYVVVLASIWPLRTVVPK